MSRVESAEGGQAGADVHAGPLQLATVLATRLQIMKKTPADDEEIDLLVRCARDMALALRRLIPRLEGPDSATGSLNELAAHAERLTGVPAAVAIDRAERLDQSTARVVLELGHRAVVEMQRLGGLPPATIGVHSAGRNVVLTVAMAGRHVQAAGPASTLPDRAALAGGSAELTWTSAGPHAVVRLPLMRVPPA